MDILYKVYAKLDTNNCIIGVESTAFYDEKDLTDRGYVKIDEGENGEVYGHAQPNYLRSKYGKSTFDENVKPNFKYTDNSIVELTDEEKEILFPVSEIKPTELDLLKEQQERTDSALQDLIIMMMGGE